MTPGRCQLLYSRFVARITVHKSSSLSVTFPFRHSWQMLSKSAHICLHSTSWLSHPGINPHLTDLRYVLHAPSVYLSVRCIPTPEQLSELDPPLLVQGCLHPSKCVFYSTSGHWSRHQVCPADLLGLPQPSWSSQQSRSADPGPSVSQQLAELVQLYLA